MRVWKDGTPPGLCVATQVWSCRLGLPQQGQVGFGLAGLGGEIFRVAGEMGKLLSLGSLG